MPRPKSTVPAYRLHKGTGQAVVYIDRREHYLGIHGSPESRQKYAELISRITVGDAPKPVHTAGQQSMTVVRSVAALCLRFIAEKLPHYAEAEQFCFRGAIKILANLFGETPVGDFGPLRLRTVRNAMVAGDSEAVDSEGKPKPRKPWSRSFVNKQIKRLKHLFRWGVSWELVPSAVADALGTVESLKIGETEATEGHPRRAVPEADLQAVRAILGVQQRDIFDLLLLTGARPGEIIGLSTGQIAAATKFGGQNCRNTRPPTRVNQGYCSSTRLRKEFFFGISKPTPPREFFPSAATHLEQPSKRHAQRPEFPNSLRTGFGTPWQLG